MVRFTTYFANWWLPHHKKRSLKMNGRSWGAAGGYLFIEKDPLYLVGICCSLIQLFYIFAGRFLSWKTGGVSHNNVLVNMIETFSLYVFILYMTVLLLWWVIFSLACVCLKKSYTCFNFIKQWSIWYLMPCSTNWVLFKYKTEDYD